MTLGEAEQLRADLFELYSLLNGLVEEKRDRALIEACDEAIRERVARLADLRDSAETA